MAKRPRNPWRRPGNSFRLGSKRAVDANLDEQRLTLYIPAYLLDWAEGQAILAGDSTVQEYCTRLLRDAIEEAKRRQRAEEAEAKRAAFEGFHEITDDPEYLVEWNASAIQTQARRDRPEIQIIEGPEPARAPSSDDAMPEPKAQGPSPAALVVLRHASVEVDPPDPLGFLATIRRGESVPEAAAVELLQALNALEVEYRDAPTLPRRVAYALHKLAFEGQVLHTDAWPGQLDEGTVTLLRTVQEAVDRVLSGEDIRYYPAGS